MGSLVRTQLELMVDSSANHRDGREQPLRFLDAPVQVAELVHLFCPYFLTI